MSTITLPAHFDGQQIVLDEPYPLEPNTALTITGGDFSSAVPLGIASGGSFCLFSKNDTPFTVTGIPGPSYYTGMAYDDTSLNLASLGGAPFAPFGISGTLADGEIFNVNLSGLGTTDFNLPVPVPSPKAGCPTAPPQPGC